MKTITSERKNVLDNTNVKVDPAEGKINKINKLADKTTSNI